MKLSKEKADRWPNTLVNLRLLREKARQDRIKKEEVLSLEDPIILQHDVHKFSKRNIGLLLCQHCSVLDHHMCCLWLTHAKCMRKCII
jgi:hypothetical protein